MKKEAVSDTPFEFTESSGNVFADLDLADADELLAKSELVHQITGLIRRRRLTQKDAAAVLGTTQPIVSDLVRRRLDRFSLERLFAFLNRLDRDVQIIIRPKPRSRSAAGVIVHTQSRALASPRDEAA
ncbi:MAG TPA: helix-turn-helix transcriptional regulator [Longimicrobium sp.]